MTTFDVNALVHLNQDFTVEADDQSGAVAKVEQMCRARYGEDLALADVQMAEPAEEQTIIGQSEVDLTAALADGEGIEREGGPDGDLYLKLGYSYFVTDALLADVLIGTIDFPCSVQLDEMSDDGAAQVASALEALGMGHAYEEASALRDGLAERVRDAMEREIAAWRVEQGIAAS